MQLIRELHRGMRGPDVRAMKRALKRAGCGNALIMSKRFGSAAQADLMAFQRHHHLKVDGVLGQKTLDKLWPFVDAYGRKLFRKAPKQRTEDLVFARLLSAMHTMNDNESGYALGAGHGVSLDSIPLWFHVRWDCSSSVSKVLHEVGLLPQDIALLSWDFLHWGEPGSGELFSVMSNGFRGEQSHVWIKLNPLKSGGYWRFDTSPHGDGGTGPRLRRLPRFTLGFSPRHAKGM